MFKNIDTDTTSINEVEKHIELFSTKMCPYTKVDSSSYIYDRNKNCAIFKFGRKLKYNKNMQYLIADNDVLLLTRFCMNDIRPRHKGGLGILNLFAWSVPHWYFDRHEVENVMLQEIGGDVVSVEIFSYDTYIEIHLYG